ncbi:substrate-binding domain-containing protein [Nocardia sp. NPDC005366]|uniref:VWA domain-containing protein n=1 Tax=Nocardia sp. NPDC005366 TaxID=3156878 RepID=UPI00339E6872
MTIVLLVVAVFAWFQFRDRAADRDSAAAAECVEGEATLFVTVDPDIEAPVRAVADKYNATTPQVRDHCAKVVVTARPSATIVAGFTAGGVWDGTLGPQPALWIPQSSRSIEATRVPGLIEGDPTPVAASPIVLAVTEELRRSLDEAKVAWSDLPTLQQGSLGDIGLSGWGGLRMAQPDGDATLAAATAVAATVSGADPLTAAAAQSGQVIAAVSGLAAGAPEVADTGAALDAIATAQQQRNADIHAVAATEQQLATRLGLVAYRPAGAAPIADHPAAMMSGQWVDQTQNLIASVFAEYLRAPEQSAIFTQAGFTAQPPETGPGASREALDKVAATLAHPVLGVQSTVVLDVSASMSTSEGSGTRLSNSLGALRSTMNVMPPDFGLGVWTFAKNLDGTKPYDVLASTAPLSTTQRTAIDTALDKVRASESRTDQAYPTVLAAYRAAVANYAAGRTNSVLIVTDGPDDDSSLTGAQLLADITAATDKARPVRIDIVVIGGSGTETLKDLTEKTGGTYTRVATSDNLTFASTVVKALTSP